MQMPTKYNYPRDEWSDKENYDKTLTKLERLFETNYTKYE